MWSLENCTSCVELQFVCSVKRGPAELQRTLEITGAILQVRKLRPRQLEPTVSHATPVRSLLAGPVRRGVCHTPISPTAPMCTKHFTCRSICWHTCSQHRRDPCKLGFPLLQHTAALAFQVQPVLCASPTPAGSTDHRRKELACIENCVWWAL